MHRIISRQLVPSSIACLKSMKHNISSDQSNCIRPWMGETYGKFRMLSGRISKSWLKIILKDSVSILFWKPILQRCDTKSSTDFPSNFWACGLIYCYLFCPSLWDYIFSIFCITFLLAWAILQATHKIFFDGNFSERVFFAMFSKVINKDSSDTFFILESKSNFVIVNFSVKFNT